MKSITVNSNKSHQYRCCQNKSHQLKCCQNKSHNTIKAERTQVVSTNGIRIEVTSPIIDRTKGISASADRTKVSRDPVGNIKIQQKNEKSKCRSDKSRGSDAQQKIYDDSRFEQTRRCLRRHDIQHNDTQHCGLNCDTHHK